MTTLMEGQGDLLDALFAQENGLPEVTLHHSRDSRICALCHQPKTHLDLAVTEYICTDQARGQDDPRSTAWVIMRICKTCAKTHDDLDNIQDQIDDGTRPWAIGDNVPPAPRGFTTQEFHPDEYDKAHAIYRSWVDKEFRMYRGWNESQTGRNAYGTQHPSVMYSADLRCDHHRIDCHCVGGLYYRAYCVGCEWWTPITNSENTAAELLLDHCWPGWCDLPVIESKQNAKYGYDYAFPKDYPTEWQVPGAPIKECRGLTKYGTRHVPSGSPYGGYKTAVTQECENHND